MSPEGPFARLTDGELLEILIGRRLQDGDQAWETLGQVVNRTMAQLRHEYGFTSTAARRVAAAAEVHHRLTTSPPPPRRSLQRPEAVFHLLVGELGPLEVERLYCLPLDARSRLIGAPLLVSVGDVDGCDAGPRSFFRQAIRTGATSAIAVHNHPSGEVDPSAADLAVTRRLIAAGRSIDVDLVDHVIIGCSGFTSIRRSHPRLWLSAG